MWVIFTAIDSGRRNRKRSRPLEQKPYWELERARLGETRKVPVEVIVNGEAVAKTEISADGSVEGVSFDVPIKKSSWVGRRKLLRRRTRGKTDVSMW